jgi:ribosomal protein L24E
VQNFTLDVLPFCGAAFTPTGQPEATGNAWPERGQALSPPGGVTYLRVVAASGASGFQLSLADGSVVGSGTDRTQLSLRAPATPYNGPLNLSYTSAGAIVTVPLGTLISGPVGRTARPVGRSDLAAIVDVSGSMSGNDPTNRRKDAVNLLIDLAGQGDRLVGTGFDSALREIFPRTTVAGNATKARLKRAAKRKIGNFGGTDYNVGLGSAFDALSADPLNPTVPKSAIFLTDGAHGGTYDNSHLRFAFNGTSTTWPVCVVQLGRTFRSSDTARLKRIARETGGTFAKAPTNAQLENLYFQCRGRSSGATILLKRTSTFRIGQSRTYAKRVKKRQRSATFFVSWGAGRYRVQLVQPGGKVFRRSAGTRVRFVSGKTSQFFHVRNPKAGRWRLRVTRLKTGAVTDRATTTVTVQRRR